MKYNNLIFNIFLFILLIIVAKCSKESIVIEDNDKDPNPNIPAIDENAPDLAVAYIKRLPEIEYVQNSCDPTREGWPEAGQEIIWRAYFKNWSPDTIQDITFQWKLDGIEIGKGLIMETTPYSLSFIDLKYTWSFDSKKLTFILDYENAYNETSEENNQLLIYTNAISVNFYVEQSVYNYFRKNQSKLDVGTNCWEDWAQILHVKRWNKMFEEAIYPETPNGVIDRIRVDSIIVVPDNALPLNGGIASNNPNRLDRTVDLQWGFPSGTNTFNFYSDVRTNSITNPFYFEGSLLHELGHARYLIDNYGFDVSNGPGGNENNIEIKENDVLIVGSSYMPFIAWDVVYYNAFDGLMSGDYDRVDLYPAICLNLIAGHRAVCGNMNAPCNIGIFLNDLPEVNILTIKDTSGNILDNSSLKVFQSSGKFNTWYGKYYDNIPDLILNSDEKGQVNIGKCPFSKDGIIRHTYGNSNGVIIIRVENMGKISYNFFESTFFNIEYWKGNTDTAYYELITNF